jgi:hypothetical protein
MSRQIRYLNFKIRDKFIRLAKAGYGTDSGLSIVTRKAELMIIDMYFGNIAPMLIHYQNYGIVVPEKYNALLSEVNLTSLANLIVKYFSKEDVSYQQSFARLNDFIKINSKSGDSIDKIIKGITDHERYYVTLDNIK